MILIDSTSAPANDVEKARWPCFGTQARDKGVASLIPVLMPQMLTAATRMANPALVKSVVGGGSTLANRPDFRPTLAHIKVPVLFLVGSDDPISPVEMDQKMHQETPGSRLVVMPGAAHAAIIEKPEACSRAFESWAGGIR